MGARVLAGRAELESLFGARSSFDETERALYGHDVAVVPPMLARLAGRAVPDGQRAERLREFKRTLDPAGLMNPRKVIGNGLLGRAVQVAGALEPAVRALGNSVRTRIGERPSGARTRDPSRHRLVRLCMLAVRLLRGRVQSVLRPRLGEPVAPGQVVLAP